MGDRWYYVATMTLRQVAHYIRPAKDLDEPERFKKSIERKVHRQRVNQISNRLRLDAQRFLGAIVVGVYGGEPEWLPVEVEGCLPTEDVHLGEREAHSFGFIRRTGGEAMFAIDGQQRLEGSREALRARPGLGAEEQTVSLVAHRPDAEGRRRTKRLFSALHAPRQPNRSALCSSISGPRQ